MTAKRKTNKNPLTLVYALAVAACVIIVAVLAVWNYVSLRQESEGSWVYIPGNSTPAAIRDSLLKADEDFGERVFRLWELTGGRPEAAHGAYMFPRGTKAISAARAISKGHQSPVKVTFNNLRTVGQLAERVASKMEFTPDDFLAACDSILPQSGFRKSEYAAAFLPDSYEFYWTAPASKVVSTLLDYRNRFWNDTRRAQAEKLGLTPAGVATIASIVEEETGKTDEQPTVARLYINRLKRNMPLQADPTVKFAVGDFSLRRIGARQLAVESPYNTYKHPGLPPGPIRIPEKATIERVLTAQPHGYLYMCAKEDFSGRHNFATDFETHKRNAARYQAALNRRGIK